LQEDIDAEVSARHAADITEATARQNAVTTLQTSINSEVSARTSADTALANSITAVQNNVNAVKGLENGLIQRLRAGGMRVLMLGDSIGRGYGADGHGILWNMEQEYSDNTYVNKATDTATLVTTTYLPNVQTQFNSLSGTFDLIFICVGANDLGVQTDHGGNVIGFPYDQFGTLPTNDWSTSMAAVHTLLYKLETSYPNAEIFWISEPTYPVNTSQYTEFYKNLRYSAQMHNCRVIDMDSIFPAYNDTAVRSKYFYDLLHPNAAGYQLMYAWVKRSIQYDWNQAETQFPYCKWMFIGANVTPSAHTLGNIKDFISGNYTVAKAIADQIAAKSVTYAHEDFIVSNLVSATDMHCRIMHTYSGYIAVTLWDNGLFCPHVTYTFSADRSNVWVSVEQEDYHSCPPITLSTTTLSGRYFTTSQSIITGLPSGVFYSGEWLIIDAAFESNMNSSGTITEWHQRFTIQGAVSGAVLIYKNNNNGSTETHVVQGLDTPKTSGGLTRIALGNGTYMIYGAVTFPKVDINTPFGSYSWFYNFSMSLNNLVPNQVLSVNLTPFLNGSLVSVNIASVFKNQITGFIWTPDPVTNVSPALYVSIICK